jgi:hypothetical protein
LAGRCCMLLVLIQYVLVKPNGAATSSANTYKGTHVSSVSHAQSSLVRGSACALWQARPGSHVISKHLQGHRHW